MDFGQLFNELLNNPSKRTDENFSKLYEELDVDCILNTYICPRPEVIYLPHTPKIICI